MTSLNFKRMKDEKKRKENTISDKQPTTIATCPSTRRRWHKDSNDVAEGL